MLQEKIVLLSDGAKKLAECRETTQQVASEMGFNGQDLWGIVSAVFEACVNALTHGRQQGREPVMLILRAFDDRLEAVVKDRGKGFACPPAVAMPPVSSMRGRGIPLMKSFMDDMKVESGDGCIVTLVKYKEPVSGPRALS
ncbi:MAG: ATP-binding protein [Armatimonadetes bacterium]|nr:ATP-binding protein [Armatimonadota bacterium]